MSFSRLLPLLSALLLLLHSSPLASAQVTSWSQVSIVSLTSSNCTQAGATAINCALPSTFVITTSGFAGISLSNAFLVLTAVDGTEIGGPGWQGGGSSQLSVWSGDGGNNVTLQATVMPQQYTPSMVAASATATAPLLNVTIRSFQFGGGSTSATQSLVSFAYDAGPTLSSISGCQGSGVQTLNCDPAVAVLTFTGSGFRWYSNPGAVQMWVNSASGTVTGQGGGPGQAALVVQSDSQMTVALSTAYVYLLLPVHYGGVPVSIFFNEPRFLFSTQTFANSYTNNLTISFIPQPGPNVTSVTLGWQSACQGINGTGPYTSCVPLVSYINIWGNYMYDVTITVGGMPCAAQVTASSSQVRCLLPALGGVGPYDVVVSDPNAATTAISTSSRLISYTPGPSVNSVTTCTTTGQTNWQGFFFGGVCLEGTTVTISGQNFPASDPTLVVLIQQQAQNFMGQQTTPAVNVTCLSPQILSSTAISCTLPTLAAQSPSAISMYGANVQLQLWLSNMAVSSNSLSVQLFSYPNAPVVTSVNGCGWAPALYTYNCGSGAIVTINGQNLNNGTFAGVAPVSPPFQFPSWVCAIQSRTATQIICAMPTFDPQVTPVQSDALYTMTVVSQQQGFNNSWAPSNAFYVSFDLGLGVKRWSQVNVLSLSSNNCTQAGNALTNCIFPVTIVITTSGYSALSINNAFLVLTGPDGTEISAGSTGWSSLTRWPGDMGQNTYLQAVVFPSSYSPTLVAASAGAVAPMLNLTIRSFQGQGSTSGVPLISFAYDAGPTLSTISGCQGSGVVTLNCDPAVAILTFTGSGFRWYTNQGAVQMWINSAQATVAGQGGQAGQAALVVQSDSQMTVNFATAYVYLLLPVHYGGVQVGIFFNERRFNWPNFSYVNSYTNTLGVSFIPQPSPNVTSVTIGGQSACQGVNGTGPYLNCVPLVSYINIWGKYMYDVSVTVGGMPCATLVPVTSSLVRCLLPALTGVGPYDVVVSDPNAAATAYSTSSKLISFTAGPSINSVTTCTNMGTVNVQGFFFGGYCAEGQTITIYGLNFPSSDPNLQVIIRRQQAGGNNVNVTCLNPQIQSSTAIACTLPWLASQTPSATSLYYANAAVWLSFSSGTSNQLQLTVYNYPNPPTVTSVSGCAVSNSALSVSSCSSGSVLTINGYNLYNASNWWSVVEPAAFAQASGPPQWYCNQNSWSATQVVCTLPTFDAQVSPVQAGVTYPMAYVAAVPGLGQEQSNAFTIDFNPAPSSSSSGLSTSAIIAIAVVVPVVSIVLLVGIVLVCISRRNGKEGGKLSFPTTTKAGTFGKQVDDVDSSTEVEIN